MIDWLVRHDIWVPEWLFSRWVDKELDKKVINPGECGAQSWQQDGYAICRGPRDHDGGHVWEVQ